MSATNKSEWVHHPRIASFTCHKVKNQRVFTPVNDRAKKLAVKCGKRTRVTSADLKPFRGYFKLREYKNGKLVSIAL